MSSGTVILPGIVVSPYTNLIYVNGADGSDLIGTGAQIRPFKTIQAALNSFGSAATQAEYAANETSRYRVIISPGVYTEDLAIPTRQIIQIDMDGVLIVGNITQNMLASVQQSAAKQSKLIFAGNDLRSMYTGATNLPLTGIQGNLTYTVTGSSTSNTPQIHLINTGVSGNVVWDTGNSPYNGQVFVEQGFIVGDVVVTVGKGLQVSLYAMDCDTSSSKAIGGCSGDLNLTLLRNVRFTRPLVPASSVGGRWINVSFGSGIAHNFTAMSGAITVDAVSRKAYADNVPTKGAEVLSDLYDTQLRSYTVSGVPSASVAGRMIYITNEVGGAVPAFSDGTNWRRVTDRAVIST